MQTANEARATADKFNVESQESELGEILQLIEKAASEGKYVTFYYDYMKEITRLKLTEMGFVVGKTESSRNEAATQIKW